MADTKISALTSATTPLDGTEVLPIVQSGATKKVANNDLRPKQIQSNATSGVLQVAGPAAATTRVMTVPNANFTAARTDAGQTFTGNNTFNGTTTVSAAEAYLALDAATLGSGKLWYAISGGGGNVSPGYLCFFNGTSGNKVFTIAPSTSEQFVTDTSGNFNLVAGNLVIGTSGKGLTTGGSFALGFGTNGSTSQATLNTSGYLLLGTSTANNRITVGGDSSTGRVVPATDNVGYVGDGNFRWQAIYAVNGTIQTSDGRQKNTIEDSNLGLAFVNSLRPVSYKWNVGENIVTYDDKNNEIVTPRPGVRVHYGFIAQEVQAAIPQGVDFGGFVYDTESDTMSLRYHEFIAPMVKAIQELKNELDSVKAELQTLKG